MRTIVVGAGVVGVCAAHSLVSRGARVTLIDAGEVGAACSYGNAGLISLGHLPIPRPGVVRQAIRWMFDPASPLYIAPRLDPAMARWLWRFRGACTQKRLECSMKTLAELSHKTVGLFERIEAQAREAGRPFFYAPRGYMEVYRTPQALDHAREHAELTKRFGFEYEEFDGAGLREREPALASGLAGAIWYPQSAFCNPHAFVMA
ncbi:MAG: FAD-dependent oxidoreductase, partial [Phycisphaeraceae bacterium]